jgi:acyl transferase domain-containing protein
VVANKNQLLERLKDWRQPESSHRGVYRGSLNSNAQAVVAAMQAPEVPAGEGTLEQLAQRWIAGAAVNWESLYESGSPARISLPTYPFARERFWVADHTVATSRSASTDNAGELHPLVSHNSSTLTDVSFSSRLLDTGFYATDHTVGGEPIFPGAGFLEIARVCGTLAAERKIHRIRDVVWMRPLSFRHGPQVLRTYLKQIGEAVEYATTSFGDDNEQVVHSEGRLLFADEDDNGANVEESVRIEQLKERCGPTRPGEDLYRGIAAHGLEYGPALRVVRELHVGDSCVLARIEVPDQLKAEFGEFMLHPAVIDGALQTAGALFGTAGRQRLYLPFALDEIDLVRPLTYSCYAFTECVPAENRAGARTRKFNIKLLNENGDILVNLRNLHMMPLDETLTGHGMSMSS